MSAPTAQEQLFDDLRGDQDVGVLLIAQMGGIPNELQLIIQTARYDEAAGGLREKAGYIVRALSAREHRITLGLFGTLFIADEHPILLHHNEPPVSVHFEGRPSDIHALMIDIAQAHASTFGPWRELAMDLNRDQPLFDLLESGAGRLATLPRPAAHRLLRVLEHHGLSARLEGDDAERPALDEHGRSTRWRLLGVGDSYIVALDFNVERMGQRV